MTRYNIGTLIRQGFRGHKDWQPAWRFPDLKERYDSVIIGGGGHGLATAYYLAKE
ncbi:MAG: sarcosine oxidase subunit beta, partial [Alphaproteobacteria bacterium]